MSHRDDSSESGEEGITSNSKERKRLALFDPISSLASALGGFEEFRNDEGEIVLEYSLGDQVVGTDFYFLEFIAREGDRREECN